MATTAEAYGFGARAPYAAPRASEYDMKERVRLSGLFPRVRNEPMSTQLQVLLKEFEQNAALTGILERRRRLEERMQFELKGREGMDALNANLAPPFCAGLAGAAVSADVDDRLARSQVPGQLAPAVQDAAAVMTGAAPKAAAKAAAKVRIRPPPAAKATAKAPAPVVSTVGMSQQGGNSASTDVVLPDQFAVAPVAKASAKAPPGAKAAPAKAPAKAPGTRRENRSPSTSRQRAG